MAEIVFFIGPPIEKTDDEKTALNFLCETGEKFICGGTSSAIIQRYYKDSEVKVDLSTASDGVPPYGKLDNITVTEGGITLKKLNQIFDCNYNQRNAASLIKKSISSAKSIKIYWGTAVNQTNGIDKNKVIKTLINNIHQTGTVTEIIKN